MAGKCVFTVYYSRCINKIGTLRYTVLQGVYKQDRHIQVHCITGSVETGQGHSGTLYYRECINRTGTVRYTVLQGVYKQDRDIQVHCITGSACINKIGTLKYPVLNGNV